jgi:tRNA threonylcarbamoyladenosine biosynthesis protein TsaE
MSGPVAAASLVIDLPREADTARLAGHLAVLLRPRDVVALHGGLGAGKTSLARAIIRNLGDCNEVVPSPTFTLVQMYDLPEFTLWHFDLFRLKAPQDAFELDIEEAFASGVSLIEWPDRLGQWLPAARLDIDLVFAGAGRRATITGHGDWIARLATLNLDS